MSARIGSRISIDAIGALGLRRYAALISPESLRSLRAFFVNRIGRGASETIGYPDWGY